MRGKTRPTVFFAACIGWLVAGTASAAHVEALRVWGSPDSTRVVLDLSAPPTDYRLVQLDNPNRIVLDVEDSDFASDFRVPGGTGLLKTIRSGKSGDSARVVLDLSGDAHPKSFLLKPAGQYGYRLVVDLYPPHAAVPPQVVRTIENDIAQGKPRPVVIAIDAGHGGDDSGARGAGGTLEKNVTLEIARQLATLIDAQPGMQAVLTRAGDYFVPLERRFQIAREHKADLFVSIHANSCPDYCGARGASVWVLSTHGKQSEAGRWLAASENNSDLIGGVSGVSLDDKSQMLAAVLLDLSQGASMQASQQIGTDVLKQLDKVGPMYRDSVQSANFVVLRSPDVPSILVETAFISNKQDENRLSDSAQQHSMAQAVLNGIQRYFENTPPPGTWFAAVRDRRLHPGQTDAATLLASVPPASGHATASVPDDDVPASPQNAAQVRATTADVAATPHGRHNKSMPGVRPPASDAYIQLASNIPPPPTLPTARTAVAASGKPATLDANIRDMHRVARGETLSGIAQQYGISATALRSVNHKIPDDGSVQAGQVLLIPSS